MPKKVGRKRSEGIIEKLRHDNVLIVKVTDIGKAFRSSEASLTPGLKLAWMHASLIAPVPLSTAARTHDGSCAGTFAIRAVEGEKWG